MEVFHALMRTGSAIGAARELCISQPAVSVWLRGLEDDLGVRLFHRVRGRLIPSSEGHILYEDVKRAFQHVQAARSTAQQLRQNPAKRLHVLAVTALASRLVPQAVASFLQEHPELQIQLSTITWREVGELVACHGADIGLWLRPPDAENFQTQRLHRARIVCIMPVDHPLTRQAEVSAADLMMYPWISYSDNNLMFPPLERACADVAVPFTAPIRVYTTAAACSLVRCGAGISVVDEFSAGSMGPGFCSRPFLPRIELDVEAVYPGSDEPSPMARAFGDHVRSLIANECLGRE